MKLSGDGRPTDTRQQRYPTGTTHAKTVKMTTLVKDWALPVTGE